MSQFKYKARFPNGLQAIFLERIFLEALNLRTIGKTGISNLTATHLNTRLTDPKANSHVELIEAKWKVQENEVIVFFYVSPTFGGQKVLTPSAKPYQGTFYNIVFQFSGVEAFLGSLADFTAKNTRAREKAIRDMTLGSAVKVYSNDPSFFYQGAWEDLAKVDGVVFDFPGPTGTGYWHNRHVGSGGLANPNVRVTKHIAQIIHEMSRLVPYITKALKQVGGDIVPAPSNIKGRDVKGRFVKSGAYATGGEEENYGIQEAKKRAT